MDAISVVLRLVDQLTGPARKAKEALTGISDAAKDVASTAEGVTSATAAVTSATQNSTSAATAATAATKGATKAAEDAADASKKVTGAVTGTTGAATAAASAMSSVADASKDAAKAGADVAESSRKTTAAVRQTTGAAEAATRATRGLTARQFALGRAIINTQRRFRIAAPEINRAGHLLGLSMRGVALGIAEATRTTLSLGRTAFWVGQRVVAATGISIAGIIALGRSYATTLDTQGKFARQTGFSVQALRELGFVAKRQDIPLETLNNGLETFQKRLGELKIRRGSLNKLLGRVDPKLRGKLRAEKDPSKAFDLVVDAMSRVKDPTKRMVLAQAAFGDAGADMVRIALLGAEALAEMREEARRLNGELGENALQEAERFNDAIDNIIDTLIGLRNSIAGTVLPVITPILEAVQELIIANRGSIATGVADAVVAISEAAKGFDWAKFADNVRAVAAAVQWAAEAVGGFENLLIGLAAVPFIPALVAIAVGVIGIISWLWKLRSAIAFVFGKGGLGRAIALAAVEAIPGLDRITAAARTTGGALTGLGRRAGGMRRMFALGGLLSIGSMILDDLTKTREQRLQAMQENWKWWSELEQQLQNTQAGQYWQSMVDEVQRWKASIAATMSSVAADMVAAGKSWIESIGQGFRAGWNDFVAWLKGAVANVKGMMPNFSLPKWMGGDGDEAPGGETGAAPPAAPKTMGDVVNNVDQSRETRQAVTVTNNVTVNTTTNASPAAIGSAAAGAAERGTRRAMGGLHDGGEAGSTYQGAP